MWSHQQHHFKRTNYVTPHFEIFCISFLLYILSTPFSDTLCHFSLNVRIFIIIIIIIIIIICTCTILSPYSAYLQSHTWNKRVSRVFSVQLFCSYKFDMYSVQLAVETQLIYCTVCTMYKNYMSRPILAIFRFFV